MVYSAADALALAQKEPDRQVVFFAIGFETTTPPTALVIRQAARWACQLQRAVLPCADPPAIAAILDAPEAGGAGGAAGRLHRPGPRQHRDRQPALRRFAANTASRW
jgi:hydrogenase expression/formation protein HypD